MKRFQKSKFKKVINLNNISVIAVNFMTYIYSRLVSCTRNAVNIAALTKTPTTPQSQGQFFAWVFSRWRPTNRRQDKKHLGHILARLGSPIRLWTSTFYLEVKSFDYHKLETKQDLKLNILQEVRGGLCNPSYWDGGIWGWLEDETPPWRLLGPLEWSHLA